MTIRSLILSALVPVLALPGIALAGPSMTGGMGKGAEASFARMDADKDGKGTREEFFAAFPQMKEGAFTTIDANGDGMISLEEWLAFSKGHSTDEAAAHPDGMGHPPMMGGTNGTAPAGDGQAPDLVMPSK